MEEKEGYEAAVTKTAAGEAARAGSPFAGARSHGTVSSKPISGTKSNLHLLSPSKRRRSSAAAAMQQQRHSAMAASGHDHGRNLEGEEPSSAAQAMASAASRQRTPSVLEKIAKAGVKVDEKLFISDKARIVENKVTPAVKGTVNKVDRAVAALDAKYDLAQRKSTFTRTSTRFLGQAVSSFKTWALGTGKLATVIVDNQREKVGFAKLHVGWKAVEFPAVDADWNDTNMLERFQDNIRVIYTVPSVDDVITARSIFRLDQIISAEPALQGKRIALIVLSQDLPFTLRRFLAQQHQHGSSAPLKTTFLASTFRSPFAKDYGVELLTGPKQGVLARALFVIGTDDVVKYLTLMPNMDHEPDYTMLVGAAVAAESAAGPASAARRRQEHKSPHSQVQEGEQRIQVEGGGGEVGDTSGVTGMSTDGSKVDG